MSWWDAPVLPPVRTVGSPFFVGLQGFIRQVPTRQGLVLVGCVWQEVERQTEGPGWMSWGWVPPADPLGRCGTGVGSDRRVLEHKHPHTQVKL